MGTGNADNSRRMDRPKAAQVTQIIQALAARGDKAIAQSIADLDKFANWEPTDSPRATVMREAADILRKLAPRQPGGDPLDDPALQAKSFRIDTETDAKELRLAIYSDWDQKGLLGYMILATPEIYDLGTDLIRRYDNLEGIE